MDGVCNHKFRNRLFFPANGAPPPRSGRGRRVLALSAGSAEGRDASQTCGHPRTGEGRDDHSARGHPQTGKGKDDHPARGHPQTGEGPENLHKLRKKLCAAEKTGCTELFLLFFIQTGPRGVPPALGASQLAVGQATRSGKVPCSVPPASGAPQLAGGQATRSGKVQRSALIRARPPSAQAPPAAAVWQRSSPGSSPHGSPGGCPACPPFRCPPRRPLPQRWRPGPQWSG